MIQEDFLELKSKLDEYSILLTFAGAFSQEIIEDLGSAIKNYLKSEDHSKSVSFNVFSVYIEQTQNIRNYLALQAREGAPERVLDSGIVTIGKTEGRYFVYSGNAVEKTDAEELCQLIRDLNNLNKEELKARYKEQLRKSRSEADGNKGAGLGLIDISRKASAPIEFALVDYDECHKYFIMKVII